MSGAGVAKTRHSGIVSVIDSFNGHYDSYLEHTTWAPGWLHFKCCPTVFASNMLRLDNIIIIIITFWF